MAEHKLSNLHLTHKPCVFLGIKTHFIYRCRDSPLKTLISMIIAKTIHQLFYIGHY